jgi:DNA-directed RNA polymerase specialized sigma24 family protein
LSHNTLHTTPISLEPLTRTNANGEVYKRSPAVERQLLDSLSLSDEDLLLRAGISDSTAAGYLQEEALVYLIRMSSHKRNQVLFNKLSAILLTRCQDQVMFRLRSLEHKEDAFNEVLQVLFETILALGNEGDYLQVRFRHALKRIAIDVFRQYYRDQTEDRQYLQPSSFQSQEDTGENENDWENIPAREGNDIAAEDRFSSVEIEVLRREALQVLKEPIRTAFVLHYIKGWPIESNDPKEVTVSASLGVTPRTVLNRLQRAKKELMKWRGDHHE